MTDSLIDALKNPQFYPHKTENIQIIQTHISWVILTGPYAYKIKKPVNFGFLDFTSLQDRQHYCQEELRLNQRLTDGLYLEVLPITGSVQQPELNGQGAVIEYALKMRQFPQHNLLSQLQQRNELTSAHIDELASQIASFHQQAPQVAADHELCRPQALMAAVQQNFDQIRPLLEHQDDLQQLDALQAWAQHSFERLTPLLEQRAANGSIRECHGDIHLNNATLLDGKVVLFDCIEFNEPFRLIDIANDAAFLAMDLEDRGRHDLANRFINSWVEQSNEYQALPLLNFYKAYRAMVRAKVNLFRLAEDTSAQERGQIMASYRSYTSLAESYCAIPQRLLAITFGTSAIGKSTVATQLVEQLGAIHIRSDVERKRIFGQQPQQHKNQLNAGIYSADASLATYQRLHLLARQALQAGLPVVLDATYLRSYSREQANEIAQQEGVPFLILACHAPDAVVADWLRQRQQQGQDPSDATMDVIQAQRQSCEALTQQEQQQAISIDTSDANAIGSLVELVRKQFM